MRLFYLNKLNQRKFLILLKKLLTNRFKIHIITKRMENETGMTTVLATYQPYTTAALRGQRMFLPDSVVMVFRFGFSHESKRIISTAISIISLIIRIISIIILTVIIGILLSGRIILL